MSPFLSHAVSVILSIVFALGLWSALVDPSRVARTLRLIGLNGGLVVPAAGVEALAASTLLVAPAFGAPVGLGYLATVTVLIAAAQLRGVRIDDCGCFARRKAIGPSFYARNCVLMALCLVVMAGASEPIAVVDIVVSGTAAVLTMLAVAHRRRSSPGATSQESPSALVEASHLPRHGARRTLPQTDTGD